MKNKGEKSRIANFVVILSLLAIYSPIITSCQSRGLTRAQAQKAITADEGFNQIVTLDYINKYLKENRKGTSEATTSDEPEATAIQNRINEYFYEEPRVQIADYLGFVEPQIKRINEQPNKRSSLTKFGFWYFNETWMNTAKGNKLWADYTQPAQETTVPLARREFVSVTGMTKINDSQMGMDFSWRWMPNELGKALDPSTEEFKSLPENMRKNLTENKYKIIQNFTYGWSGDRPGQALFRHHDNGWRLEWIKF